MVLDSNKGAHRFVVPRYVMLNLIYAALDAANINQKINFIRVMDEVSRFCREKNKG
jgi:hypothetical protein